MGVVVYVGVDGGLFFVFKSLDNNMISSLCVNVYVYKRNRCTTKVLWVLNFLVGGRDFFFQNHSR